MITLILKVLRLCLYLKSAVIVTQRLLLFHGLPRLLLGLWLIHYKAIPKMLTGLSIIVIIKIYLLLQCI